MSNSANPATARGLGAGEGGECIGGGSCGPRGASETASPPFNRVIPPEEEAELELIATRPCDGELVKRLGCRDRVAVVHDPLTINQHLDATHDRNGCCSTKYDPYRYAIKQIIMACHDVAIDRDTAIIAPGSDEVVSVKEAEHWEGRIAFASTFEQGDLARAHDHAFLPVLGTGVQ